MHSDVKKWAGASVNLKIKCKGCDRVHDVAFADEGHDDEEYGWKPDKGQFQRFASFECRGLDPVRYRQIIQQFITRYYKKITTIHTTIHYDNSLWEITKRLPLQNPPFCICDGEKCVLILRSLLHVIFGDFLVSARLSSRLIFHQIANLRYLHVCACVEMLLLPEIACEIRDQICMTAEKWRPLRIPRACELELSCDGYYSGCWFPIERKPKLKLLCGWQYSGCCCPVESTLEAQDFSEMTASDAVVH